MEMRTPACCNTPVNANEVNWLPWSELKISGWPNRAKASCNASMQNFAPPVGFADITPWDRCAVVFDTRQDSTFRIAQSISGEPLGSTTATR